MMIPCSLRTWAHGWLGFHFDHGPVANDRNMTTLNLGVFSVQIVTRRVRR